MDTHALPTRSTERYVILDALRGFALLGIALANYPEFSLYTFLHADIVESMPTYGIDRIVRFLQYFLIDGKFYTIFSLLFGIGFAIIISHAAARGADGFRVFYRRMGVLTLIGLVHLMFIWSGDILMLYALLGLLLPLFRRVSDRCLLGWAVVCLVVPVFVDAMQEAFDFSLSATVVGWQHYWCDRYGITDQNFAYWLRDATDYATVFQFLIQGALVRVQEFVDGNRYFRVFGLFLIGFYIGRHRLYADLAGIRPQLRHVFRYGLAAGIPLSLLYAWSGTHHHVWGLTVHSLLYLVSVFPMGFAYVAGLCLLYLHRPRSRAFRLLAAPGRMALTNYIGQSLVGMFLFYGIGMGWGASVGLTQTEAVALIVYACLLVGSRLWLSACNFGPLEWLWRMLTYGRRFPLLKQTSAR